MSRRAPKAPPLRPMHLPPIATRELDSGLRVVAVRRGPIPLVTSQLTVRAGSSLDPPGKPGLAHFAWQLLRRGTETRSADAIDEAVEMVGGHLSIGVNRDWCTLAITSPAQSLAAMLEILSDLARAPAFPADEVDSARQRTLAELANDLDDPSLIADRAIIRAVWGGHPYGHPISGSSPSVAQLSREDLQRHHRACFGPKVAQLAIVGAVEPEQAFELASTTFGGWGGGPERVGEVPPQPKAMDAGRVLVLDRNDLTQTQIRLGWAGLPRRHPDTVPAFLMGAVLGGGFSSRLVRAVRVQRGLTYGISSSFSHYVHGGLFDVDTFTKSETTRETIDVVLAEMRRLRDRGPKPAELAAVQRYVVGLYPTSVERNESIAYKLAEIWAHQLGADWIEAYREKIATTPLDAVAEAARRYLLVDPPAVIAVGNAAAIKAQLAEGLGPVTVRPLAEYE